MSNPDEKEILKRFGRYLILDHIADGGMAKICRARYLGEQADKIVTIKMIQPQFSKDEAFKKMFEDEIKVTFSLIHPNIAQTYNTGTIENQLFVSMEYVDGKNLKQYLDRLKERNFVFPVEISVYIIAQVCQALNYAHNFTDKLSGRQLKIVHRDISPHNIMITYDGVVKVIDFGIAKADTNTDATQAGTIKGKLSYLAPEYLDGLKLDHRYDEFAVGITLWELLCSRKLFKAPNELAVLKLIQACKVPPPSSINPNVPKELDEIVLKALSKDRNLRYDNLDKMNRELVKFLYSKYPDFNPTDLAYFSKELFKEEIRVDREKLKEYGKIDLNPFLKELEVDVDKGTFGGDGDKKFKVNFQKGKAGVKKSKKELDFGFEAQIKTGQIDLDNEKPTDKFRDLGGVEDIQAMEDVSLTKNKKQEKMELASTKIHNLGNGGGQIAAMPDMSQRNSRTVSGHSQNEDGTRSSIRKTGSRKVVRSSSRTKILNISLAVASVLAILFHLGYIGPKPVTDDPCANGSGGTGCIIDHKGQVKSLTTLNEGKLTFKGTNFDQKFYLNGSIVEIDKTFKTLRVPFDQNIKLKITQEGRQSFVANFSLSENNKDMTIQIPDMPKEEMGEIVVGRGDFSNTELMIEIEGDSTKYQLPLSKPLRVPAGTYDAILVDKTFDTQKKIKIVVPPDQRAKINR